MENENPASTPQPSPTPAVDINALSAQVAEQSKVMVRLKQEIHKVIIGQQDMVDKLLIALLAGGHVLLEGVPGLAKTLAISTMSKASAVDFHRIQFTPDLLPADLIGTMIYNQKKEEFRVEKGPVFANFILADEINRAPAKVQSALLESMQERQVTIGHESYPLPKPFMVLATQNPVEQEGTYPLPEAQTDRFMLKIVIQYPTREEEKLIIQQNLKKRPTVEVNPVITADQIMEARNWVKNLYMDEKIEQYIVDIVFATRFPKDAGLPDLENMIQVGASPRASISLAIAAKAQAFLQGRGYVVPEDVRSLCKDVLRHRIAVTYEAEANNITSEQIITEILNKIEIP